MLEPGKVSNRLFFNLFPKKVNFCIKFADREAYYFKPVVAKGEGEGLRVEWVRGTNSHSS